jgi:predicted RNA-binding Zn ribbon-like protein
MTSSKDSFENRFLFVGNYLCLDFINTEMVEAVQPVDRLTGFDNLVAWLAQSRTLDGKQAEAILGDWKNSREARATLQDAVKLRASLREMAERLVKEKTVPQSTVAAINQWLAHQTGHAELKRARGRFEKHFQADFREPAQLLWPVAESAADLLCYADVSLVKKCENPSCVVFFYDTTKNHSRRWCSMSACGNRMKVAAHYQRLRERDNKSTRNE